MAKDRKRRLLAELRQKKYSCRPSEAEAALTAWGFTPGRKQGHSQVWSYKFIQVTVHEPHGKGGGNNLDPGAVAMIIRKIEEAEALQQKEREETQNVH